VAMGRAPCCDKANVKRGPWSPEEDAALKTYVDSHGTGGNWIALPKKAGFSLFSPNTIHTFFQHLLPTLFLIYTYMNICLFILCSLLFQSIEDQIKVLSK